MSFTTGHVAQVHDLAAARARRADREAVKAALTAPAFVDEPAVPGDIPADVWAEVEAANRLFEELHDDGHQIVFDDGHLDGRLVIALCDLEGRVLRAVPPAEVVTALGTGAPGRRQGGDAA